MKKLTVLWFVLVFMFSSAVIAQGEMTELEQPGLGNTVIEQYVATPVDMSTVTSEGKIISLNCISPAWQDLLQKNINIADSVLVTGQTIGNYGGKTSLFVIDIKEIARPAPPVVEVQQETVTCPTCGQAVGD